MSKQTLNLGTAPTGAGGDTPRGAFTKVQANIDEIYTALGATGSPQVIPTATPIANGGTGATTAAAARTNLGLKTAALADITGSVATGAIMEIGSNANGFYVKYACGLMMCAQVAVKPALLNTSNLLYIWTFPVSFANYWYGGVNVVGPIGVSRPINTTSMYNRDNATAACSLLSQSAFASTDPTNYGLYFDVFAIGRWI